MLIAVLNDALVRSDYFSCHLGAVLSVFRAFVRMPFVQ